MPLTSSWKTGTPGFASAGHSKAIAFIGWLVVAFLWSEFALAAAAKDATKTPPTIGRFIRVPLPINGQTFERTRRMARKAMDRAKKENVRLVLVFEFSPSNGNKDAGRGSEFGAAHDLANFLSSEELNAVRTVAYVPRSLEGHAVLAVLACQEIVMAQDASIGTAGIDEKTITPTLRSAYSEIANRRRTVPAMLALGMLDQAMEVLKVETEVGSEFVTAEGLANLKKTRVAKEPVVVKRAGEAGMYSGNDARRLGFASYLAADRRALVKALELPSAAVEDDPSLESGWRAVRVDLKGPIRADSVDQVQRMIEKQIHDFDANFICLWIESPGGSMSDAMRLADYLAFRLDPSKVRTVAYVPIEARADAAVVALACDQLVMHSRAVLGGSGASEPSGEEIEIARQTIQNQLAPRKGRSWSLMAAMIDPKLTVFRCTRLGDAADVEFFCEEELKEQLDPKKWERGAPITTPDMPLKLVGSQAEEYHLTNAVVESFAQFRQYYGLENDPLLVEPGWIDFLIRALASPGAAAILLLLGGAALYIELHVPGIGIGGFVATVCFLLFFWSRYLGGTADWLAISLFMVGMACLLLEIFVIPGFGIFGLGGGLLVLTSFILASQTFFWPRNEYQFEQLQNSLLTVASAGIGVFIVGAILRKHLPRAPLFGRMMLEPPAGEEAQEIGRRESLVDFHALLGQRGTTTTQLTPGGKARFATMLVDVISDSEVIDRGTPVEVIEVRGNHVLVKKVS